MFTQESLISLPLKPTFTRAFLSHVCTT